MPPAFVNCNWEYVEKELAHVEKILDSQRMLHSTFLSIYYFIKKHDITVFLNTPNNDTHSQYLLVVFEGYCPDKF